MEQRYFEELKSSGAILAITRQLVRQELAKPDECRKIKSALSHKERSDTELKRNVSSVPVQLNRVRKEDAKQAT